MTQENQLDPVKRNGENSFFAYIHVRPSFTNLQIEISEFSKYQKMDGGILTVSETMAVNESVEKHLSKVYGLD